MTKRRKITPWKVFFALLDKCDESMDLIVLHEYSDALADVKGKYGFYNTIKQYNPVLLKRACKTAKRCNSLVFVNAGHETENGIRNTTHAIDINGNIVGRYFKAHPLPARSRPMPRADTSWTYINE